MITIPELVPISELRQRQQAILDQLAQEPVVLTLHGVAVAVLVDPRQWNELMTRLDDQEDAAAGLQAALDVARGQDVVLSWSAFEAGLDGA